MKKLFTLVFFALVTLSQLTFGQHHYADWHKHINGQASSSFNNILYDGENLIANGHWFLSGDFEDIELPYFISANTLLVKMSKDGDIIWHTTVTGDGYESFFDMAFDSDKNIVMAGWSTSASPIEINGEVVYTPEFEWVRRAVVAKFSGTDGSLMWYKTFGPDEEYLAVSTARLTVDPSNNIYIGGEHDCTFNLGAFELENTQEYYGSDLYIAKFDPNGNPLWAESYDFVTEGFGGWASPKSLKFDNGKLFVAIEYSKPLIINGEELPYEGEFYWLSILKMDPNSGVIEKAKCFGSSNGGQGFAHLAIDKDQNIVVGGWFEGNNNPLIIGDISLTGYGLQDGFVLKFNPDLDLLWANNMGSSSITRAFNVKVDDNNRIHIGGGYQCESAFKYDNKEVINPNPSNSLSKFHLILNSDASLLRAYAMHTANEWGMFNYSDFAVTPGDIVYSVGYTVDSISFQPDTDFFSDHNSGYVMRWNLSGETNSIVSIAQDMTIYPNPASDLINIRLTNEMREVRILDVTGRVAQSTSVKGTEVSLSISNLNSGIYIAQIFTTDGGVYTQKIIIQ